MPDTTVTGAVVRCLADQTDDRLRDYTRAYARWALISEGEMRGVHLARLKFTVIATSNWVEKDDPIAVLWASFTRHQVENANWTQIAEALAAAELVEAEDV
jgi:hypothetical protein